MDKLMDEYMRRPTEAQREYLRRFDVNLSAVPTKDVATEMITLINATLPATPP